MDVQVHNNLTDGMIVARDGAAISMEGNITSATAKLFRSPSSGELHLTRETPMRANLHRDCPLDWDGERRRRPQTSAGGDETVANR